MIGCKVVDFNCFTITGDGIYLSKNKGAQWTPVDNGLLNLPVYALDVSDMHLFAGTRGAGVWRCPLSEMKAPELSAVDSVLYQSEFIEVTSTKDGMIYLVPENTNKDLTSIRGVCVDSVEAIAGNVVTINISGLGNGKYWLYARDGSDNISEYKEFTIAGVGIENILAGQIRIFPTTTSKLITIQVGNAGKFSIEIISMNGRHIHNEEMEGTTHQVDMTQFIKGVYFVTVRSKEFARTEKVVKL